MSCIICKTARIGSLVPVMTRSECKVEARGFCCVTEKRVIDYQCSVPVNKISKAKLWIAVAFENAERVKSAVTFAD